MGNPPNSDNVAESSFRIEVRNAREEAVSVRIQEPLPGDWEMVQDSHRHSKESSRLAVWNLAVPASGASVLEYTVRVRW